jgi:hypothetical protein
VEAVPAPYGPGHVEHLDDSERADLVTCEQAVAGLHRALAVAGKALATIQKARLYRESHPTFEAYVEDRWGMKRAHAYRLIDAWPVAAALSPIGDNPINEAQVRELLPAVKRHGLEAGTAVYKALTEDSGRVTAARIREAVRALPKRLANPEDVPYLVRTAAREAAATAQSTGRDAEGQGDGEVVDAELVEDGSRAVAVLASVLDRQRRVVRRARRRRGRRGAGVRSGPGGAPVAGDRAVREPHGVAGPTDQHGGVSAAGGCRAVRSGVQVLALSPVAEGHPLAAVLQPLHGRGVDPGQVGCLSRVHPRRQGLQDCRADLGEVGRVRCPDLLSRRADLRDGFSVQRFRDDVGQRRYDVPALAAAVAAPWTVHHVGLTPVAARHHQLPGRRGNAGTAAVPACPVAEWALLHRRAAVGAVHRILRRLVLGPGV